MRAVVFTVAIAFIAFFGVLTVQDFSRHGATAPDVIAVLILVVFMVGIIGAAVRRPPGK